MDAQLGGRMNDSMVRFYISERIINQLMTKDQDRALISTIHRVAELIGLAYAKNQSRIGVSNGRHAFVVEQKDSTARHHDLGYATLFLVTAT